MRTTRVKTAINRVFLDQDDHRVRLNSHVEKITRFSIHATQFIKWYMLNCPEVDQLPSHQLHVKYDTIHNTNSPLDVSSSA